MSVGMSNVETLQTVVGMNPWVVHRNQKVFGEDVDEFKPERWLGEDVGDLRRLATAIPSTRFLMSN
jgi:cytochrome P450